MPIFEYKCKDCNAKFEKLVLPGKETDLRCPECDSDNTEKLLSVIGLAKVNSGESSTQSSCCGLSNPCNDPKRCCGS